METLTVPDFDWTNNSVKPNPQYTPAISHKMLDIMDDFSLTQIQRQPTRGVNILDLICTTHPDRIAASYVVPGMSDHEAVIFDINIKATMVPTPPRKVYLFNRADFQNLSGNLEVLYESFIASDPASKSVQDNWSQFKHDFFCVIKEFIPQKILKNKRSLPWCNSKIKRLIRQKQRRHKTARRTGSDFDWRRFREIRKRIHAELRQSHQQYINGLLDLKSGDCDPDTTSKAGITRRFWRYIKAKRRDPIGISALKVGDQEITDPQQKADILNIQYSAVFTQENPLLPTLPDSIIPDMPSISINTNGVIKLLQGLNPSKANGPDQIPTRVLKEAAPVVGKYLTFIFQQSLKSGQIPNDWKHAHVTPVFKKGSRLDPANYRPVSLTSVACKVLEHVIYKSIMTHLEEHNILVDFQHGFRKFHSCETQLVNTVEDLARSINYRRQTDVLILDFSKAFDKVPHQRLLQKFEQYGVRGETLNWINSWLTGRTQQVILEGSRSERTLVKSGVPQGTVLGPLCFLVYINDIGDNISSPIRLFADDTLLYGLVHSVSDAHNLQLDLDRLIIWAQVWQMEFHPSKCFVLRICRTRNPIIYPYSMLGQTLKPVENHPYLGIILSESLNWKSHVLDVKNKANRTLGFVKRNLYMCPERVKAQAYISLVRPKMEYASAVWDPFRAYQIKWLEQVQRGAARFVTQTYSREEGCVTRALDHLGWPTLEQRRYQSRLKLLHKSLNNEAAINIPPYVHHQSSLKTRSSHPMKFIPLQTSCDTYKYSFWPRTISDWNKLPSTHITLPYERFSNTLLSSI